MRPLRIAAARNHTHLIDWLEKAAGSGLSAATVNWRQKAKELQPAQEQLGNGWCCEKLVEELSSLPRSDSPAG